MRRRYRAQRVRLAAADPDAAVRAAEAAPLERLPGLVIGGYLAQGSELDPAPLMARLATAGRRLTLPAAADRSGALVFRAWAPGAPLAPDAFGIPAPLPEAEVLTPDLLIVPLLAFDRAGGRLVQGAGIYDRTIAALSGERAPYLVGYAYAGQEAPRVPMEPHDQPLDAIATEAGFVEVR